MTIRQTQIEKVAAPDSMLLEALRSGTEALVRVTLQKHLGRRTNTDVPERRIPHHGNSKIKSQHHATVTTRQFSVVLNNLIKYSEFAQRKDREAGFHRSRSRTYQSAIIRVILEQSVKWSTLLNANFLNYEEALDNGERKTLEDLPQQYGVPEKIFTSISKVVHEEQRIDLGEYWCQTWLLTSTLFLTPGG
ncbi:unnamed protein product [Schistosoma curassoni]|uniref:DDE_Tnp_Tn3 domain-containing protein n=1 Tax=Schistosoma curassoni TaxID=6186 RepID=A0A183K6L4_9TREM|nr:unnamed protein product [Schistosoma curassoni]